MAKITSSRLSFAISYGFVSGPLHGRLMSRLLRQQGYIESTLQNADIIIAHSACCWLIPPDGRPKLVIYVGMPLAKHEPRKTWLAAQRGPKTITMRRRYLRAVHIYYLMRQPRRNRNIARMTAEAGPQIFSQVRTVFITNRHDPWPKDPEQERLLAEQPWSFIGLPGGHNNIWRDSESYIPIINHYARLLAKTDA